MEIQLLNCLSALGLLLSPELKITNETRINHSLFVIDGFFDLLPNYQKSEDHRCGRLYKKQRSSHCVKLLGYLVCALY
jgi:hypothetical protein